MAALFVDTSAWYPLAVTSHPEHVPLAEVLTERVRASARIVTTALVLAETHALLARTHGRAAALRFTRTVMRPPNAIEYATPERLERAIGDWLEAYPDLELSLADALSLAVMAELGIAEALALDGRFAAAGFSVVGERTGGS